MFFLIINAAYSVFAQVPNSAQVPEVQDEKERMRRIFAQGAVFNAGIEYSREFKFDLAFQKLMEATQAQYLTNELDKSYPLARLSDLYRELGKCQESLEILKWHEKHLTHPASQEGISEKKAQLIACIAWQETGNKKPIYDFIEVFKNDHNARIPPAKFPDQLVMSTIAELYDLIGDYDTGIAWVKKFKKMVKMKSTKKEYDALIQAFEESKRGMPKVCSDDGKYCVGRATAVIIRSKYF